MDVAKMFPSLRAADVAKIVKEEYLQAKLEVEVDEAELSLFLAIEMSREELEDLGLGEVVGKRKRRGRPVLITTNWVMGERGGQAENLFHEPGRRPTTQERRLLLRMLNFCGALRSLTTIIWCSPR